MVFIRMVFVRMIFICSIFIRMVFIRVVLDWVYSLSTHPHGHPLFFLRYISPHGNSAVFPPWYILS